MKISLNNIVDSLLSQQSRSQVFLQRTRKLDPNDPADKKIYELMQNPSFRDRITGHLLNLITSGERAVFCISVRSLCQSIKADPNWKRKAALNADDRRTAFGILRKFLVDEIVAFDNKLATPGVYRLKNPLVRVYLSEKLGIDLFEIEREQEQQCIEWINQKKENRSERLKIVKPVNDRSIHSTTSNLNQTTLDLKLRKRIAGDVYLASIEGQPIAGRTRIITLASRDILGLKKEDIPFDIFESYEEYREAECKAAMREACKVSLNHWLETAKESELETHHRICELMTAYADVITGKVKKGSVQLSFDVAASSSKMLERIAFTLLGIRSGVSQNSNLLSAVGL